MVSAYCFDTSALITLGERSYPENVPVFEPIWNHIYSEISSKEIIFPILVNVEISAKADEWRKPFLIKASDNFIESEDLEKSYADLINQIETDPNFKNNGHRTRFMGGADPWVIALARIEGCTVVSSEQKNMTQYGMGAICAYLGINHNNLIDFFKDNIK